MKVTSNIQSFNKTFKKYVNSFPKKLSKFIEYICDEFYNKLYKNINKALPNEHIDDFSFTNDIQKVKKGDLYWVVELGKNSVRYNEKTGDAVNPFYYFEFGFGYIGNLTPLDIQSKAYQMGWEYDVNNHDVDGWKYKALGSINWTQGIEGEGYIRDTIYWFEKNQQKIVEKALKKAGIIK